MMTLMKGYFGSAVLALPYCFNEAGWVLSSVILMVTVVVLMLCVYTLLEVGNECKEQSGLSELSERVLGDVMITRAAIVVY
jgi:proton-coupled amino acid transporter